MCMLSFLDMSLSDRHHVNLIFEPKKPLLPDILAMDRQTVATATYKCMCPC